jgi:hypothetical protein
MTYRTDAGRIVLLSLLSVAGCATIAKREPTPANLPSPTKTEPIRFTPTPQAADIRQVSHQVPETSDAKPDADAPRRLYREAVTEYARQPSYIARLKRREWANGQPRPEETLIFKFREDPWSVHFKWLDTTAQGREVLYVRGQHADKLHILTAANDVPFTPGGRHLALALDSVLVRSSSRYPITEAGIGRVIERYGRLLDAVDKKQSGAAVKYLGPTQRPEYQAPLEGVECQLPANFAPEVPQGGKRLVFFDPTTTFPVVTATYDLTGQEVDYACFDRLQLGVRLDDDDFNPDKLWDKKP